MIRVYEDPETASAAAAGLFVELAQEAVRDRGRFAVALAGGNTPRRTYELLASDPLRGEVAWNRVHLFFGDERCVPLDDERSNYRTAREALISRVPVPAGQVHPILCYGAPESGARRYEIILRNYFGGQAPRLDLVLLGLGDDAHTASLFPGTEALSEKVKWTAAVCPPGQDLCRVSLTPPLLNQARTVAFLVSGASKAAAVRDVLEGPRSPERLPAQLVRPEEGEVVWVLDRDAARLLTATR